MITVRFHEKQWIVGIDDGGARYNSFLALRECPSREEAMAWVSYLNGGMHPFLAQTMIEGALDMRKQAQTPQAPRPVPVPKRAS
jgi:hypothetical protein